MAKVHCGLTMVSAAGATLCVGVLRSCSTFLATVLLPLLFPVIAVLVCVLEILPGGTTPHFSQHAMASSIQDSSNISRDHSTSQRCSKLPLSYHMKKILMRKETPQNVQCSLAWDWQLYTSTERMPPEQISRQSRRTTTSCTILASCLTEGIWH